MAKIKWLEYFSSYVTSKLVLNEMHDQITPQFETLINKKVDWNKIWLFVEPIGQDKIFQRVISPEGSKRVYLLTAEIRYKQCPITITLYWQSKVNNRWINISEKINPDEIEFVLESTRVQNKLEQNKFSPKSLDFGNEKEQN